MYKNYYISEENIKKFIQQFNILKYKIYFDLPLTKIDEDLIHILEEYDYLIEYIVEEQKKCV